jgi:hypothetical protein
LSLTGDSQTPDIAFDSEEVFLFKALALSPNGDVEGGGLCAILQTVAFIFLDFTLDDPATSWQENDTKES